MLTSLPPGRVADQKRIRKLMRILAIPSPAHIAVWQESYWRWRMLKEMSGKGFSVLEMMLLHCITTVKRCKLMLIL